jgi:HAD superfamily hydrolase (TIGR01490 family)
MKKTIAIFDLDKTLIPFDCDEAWGHFLHERGWAEHDFLSRQAAFFAQYDAGTLDIHEYQRFSIAATIKAGPVVAQQALADFVEQRVRPHLSHAVRQLIGAHRQQGHHLLVITATNVFVSRAVVDALGIADLLAIDLAVDDTGWFTGQIEGTPSFREGKVTRLHTWLGAQGWQRSDVALHFYSDSTNDLPLLSVVDHPVATNPSPDLREHALRTGWPVLDLFGSLMLLRS